MSPSIVTGDGGGGKDGTIDRPLVEDGLGPPGQIGGDRVEGDPKDSEIVRGQIPRQQAAQGAVVEEAIPMRQEVAGQADGIRAEDLAHSR